MLDGNAHVSSVCESNPACLVSTGNKFYNPSTTDWGCPPMENRLGEMYNQESNFWANGEQMDPIWNSQDSNPSASFNNLSVNVLKRTYE